MGNFACSPSASDIYHFAFFGNINELKHALSEDYHKIGIKYADSEGKTALMCAAKNGHTECVTLLLKGNGLSYRPFLPYFNDFFFFFNVSPRLSKYTIKAASKLHARTNDRTTVLMYAVAGGHADCVNILLKAGANPSARGPKGKTALILASGFKLVYI